MQQLGSYGCQVEQDVFTAKTPFGPKRMNNIIAKIAGTSGNLVVIQRTLRHQALPRNEVRRSQRWRSIGRIPDRACARSLR